MKWLYFTILLFALAYLQAQSKQDYVWLLGIDQSSEPGNQAYRFDFNQVPFGVMESNNGLGFSQNNASICDAEGNLLFYSNGCSVLNRNSELMPNGDSLNYDIWIEILNWDDCRYGYPGTQNIMILDVPGSDHLFYLIHKPRIYNGRDEETGIPLWYSLVDMSLNDGLGDVVEKNVEFYSEHICLSSYLTAIKHSNQTDWWILQPQRDTNVYLTFLIDAEGIHRQEDQIIGKVFDLNASSSGTAKFSPDGSKYAYYNESDGLLLFDFDRNTGLLSNYRRLITFDTTGVGIFCSVEWSPNSRFIYTATQTKLHQVDTWEESLEDGVRLIDTYNGTRDPFATTFFLMAQGPDCRIYMCPTSGTRSYHVINKPDELGTACDFVQNGIRLPMASGAGSFPNFPRFRVDEEEKCDPSLVSVFGQPVWYRRDLSVFPNPSTGYFQIKVPEGKMQKLLVMDLNGQILFQRELSASSSHEEIDLTHLPNGYYHIEIWPADEHERVFYGTQVVKME